MTVMPRRPTASTRPPSCGGALAGAGFILLFLATTAAAQPACVPVSVHGCEAFFDEASLRRALRAEGVSCDVDVRCRGGELVVNGAATEQRVALLPEAVRVRIVARLVAERLRSDPASGLPPARQVARETVPPNG